jgi:hypothetical protein
MHTYIHTRTESISLSVFSLDTTVFTSSELMHDQVYVMGRAAEP